MSSPCPECNGSVEHEATCSRRFKSSQQVTAEIVAEMMNKHTRQTEIGRRNLDEVEGPEKNLVTDARGFQLTKEIIDEELRKATQMHRNNLREVERRMAEQDNADSKTIIGKRTKFPDDDTPELVDLPGFVTRLVRIYEPGSRHTKYIECTEKQAIELTQQLSKLLGLVCHFPLMTCGYFKEEKK